MHAFRLLFIIYKTFLPFILFYMKLTLPVNMNFLKVIIYLYYIYLWVKTPLYNIFFKIDVVLES